MASIHIIEDDEIMAECVAQACQKVAQKADIRIFSNAITAIQAADTPDLIFLDILLTGPDGFTYLNEIASYPDTAKIPVIIVSSLDFKHQNLAPYGVVATLDKSTMKPADIQRYVRRYLAKESSYKTLNPSQELHHAD